MAIAGAGYLTALDVLCDLSYQLFEPIANTVITSISSSGGEFTLGVISSASLYAGALIAVGYGTAQVEITTVDLVVNSTTIKVGLVNAHNVGDKIFAPTFPVQQPTDPLWTQAEMLAYLSSACNDFLTDVPLVYGVNPAVNIQPTQQNGLLPSDCMEPMRVAFQMPVGPYPMRETSQANLDAYDYRWQSAQPGAPQVYFRDKMPLQNFGIWPRVNNTAVFEIVYSRRQGPMQLLDGFLFPDMFVPVVKYRTLSFAYSKDGEARNPGLAKYFAARYEFGAKVAGMILAAVNDPNLEMAQ